jgi:hypothetical protein
MSQQQRGVATCSGVQQHHTQRIYSVFVDDLGWFQVQSLKLETTFFTKRFYPHDCAQRQELGFYSEKCEFVSYILGDRAGKFLRENFGQKNWHSANIQ